MKNLDHGFPDQGLLLPIHQIINPAQNRDVAPGKGERQEPEEPVVQVRLEELAQAEPGFPERRKLRKPAPSPGNWAASRGVLPAATPAGGRVDLLYGLSGSILYHET